MSVTHHRQNPLECFLSHIVFLRSFRRLLVTANVPSADFCRPDDEGDTSLRIVGSLFMIVLYVHFISTHAPPINLILSNLEGFTLSFSNSQLFVYGGFYFNFKFLV
jgi:hypothetical protein